MNNSIIAVNPSICLESVTCVSSTNGTCVVYIGRNKSDALSRMSFNGSINSSISTANLSINEQDIFYAVQFDIGQSILIEDEFSMVKGNIWIYNMTHLKIVAILNLIVRLITTIVLQQNPL